MAQRLRGDVFADPGVCADVLTRVLAEYPAEPSDDRFDLRRRDRVIPLRGDGTLDLERVRSWSTPDEVDFQVIVTEIPRRAGRRPKMSEVHVDARLVIISLPALGTVRLATKLRRSMRESLEALIADRDGRDAADAVSFGTVHRQDSDLGRSFFVSSPWWWPGRLRLVIGMVRTNEPLRDVRKLKGLWAAGAGTAAFGVFYSSIWQMANALPFWRLGLISGMAIALMVTWLILSNRLWEGSRKLGNLTEATMYNLSTVATLVVSVAAIYVILFLGILVAALIIIESGYMAGQLGVPAVSLRNYLRIAWLAASLGTLAGALGANFDSEADIRTLTQGRRQVQRYSGSSD